MQVRATQHRRLVGAAVAILIAATLVALAVPVAVNAFLQDGTAIASGPAYFEHR